MARRREMFKTHVRDRRCASRVTAACFRRNSTPDPVSRMAGCSIPFERPAIRAAQARAAALFPPYMQPGTKWILVTSSSNRRLRRRSGMAVSFLLRRGPSNGSCPHFVSLSRRFRHSAPRTAEPILVASSTHWLEIPYAIAYHAGTKVARAGTKLSLMRMAIQTRYSKKRLN